MDNYFYNKKVKDKDLIYQYVAIGATAGLIGQFVGEKIYQFFLLASNDENPYVEMDIQGYLAGIISGAAIGALALNLSLFSTVVLSVGMFYATYEGLKFLFGKELLGYQELLYAFIQDVIIVYFLLFFERNIFRNTPDEEGELIFSDEVLANIISGIVINAYYGVKRIRRHHANNEQ